MRLIIFNNDLQANASIYQCALIDYTSIPFIAINNRKRSGTFKSSKCFYPSSKSRFPVSMLIPVNYKKHFILSSQCCQCPKRPCPRGGRVWISLCTRKRSIAPIRLIQNFNSICLNNDRPANCIFRLRTL